MRENRWFLTGAESSGRSQGNCVDPCGFPFGARDAAWLGYDSAVPVDGIAGGSKTAMLCKHMKIDSA